jgi:L-iditol 2-dehydrogenase
MTPPVTMKFGLYYAANDVRVTEKPVPSIGPAEVLVRVATCGICGSDTMQWYREPAVERMGGINTGHEIAGEVVAVGELVRSYKPGDRVVVVHHFPCMRCIPCLDGNETACEAMRDKYIEPGGFSQYIRVLEPCVANGMYPLPHSMSFEQGSFVEPLACVVRGARKTAPIAGRTVLIFGSGLAGLLHVKLTRHLGAARITAVDTNPNRLEAARRAGADEAIHPSEALPPADRVYVCTGSLKAAESALDCINRGGHILFFATDGPDKQLAIPLTRFWTMQPTVGFSYGAAPRDMGEALNLIASGSVSVADLVTHRFGIDRIAEAFQIASNPRDSSLKVIVEPNLKEVVEKLP